MSTYGVELLYAKAPTIKKADLLAALRRHCPGARPLDHTTEHGQLAFVHEDHPIELSDGTIHAQTFISAVELTDAESLEAALQQTWDYDPHGAIARCRAAVLLTDLLSSELPHQHRLDLFCRSLLAVLDVAMPDAIHWRPSQRIVDPTVFQDASDDIPFSRFFNGPLNVRLFNLAETDGEMVMDTMGLAALGLPDLQCHFKDLAPSDLAPLLYNLAFFVFENGDVIEDGNTVDGAMPGTRWLCQHEDALIPPERDVLDLDPGPDFGGRHQAGP